MAFSRTRADRRTGSGFSWSPDAQQIAFQAPKGLAVINRDGSGFRVLERLAYGDVAPTWSPDGRWIAYLRDFPTRCKCRYEVFVIPPRGGSPRRLTDETAKPLDPERYVQFGPIYWALDSRRVYSDYVHFGE